MKLEAGKTYVCTNGVIVTLVRNSLPHYKFSCIGLCVGRCAIDECDDEVYCSEVWTEDGVAYHNDCGYNIAYEYKTQTEKES